MSQKIFLLITDAGGGHRAPAVALKRMLDKAELALDIKIINFYGEITNCVLPWFKFKTNHNDKTYAKLQKRNLGILLYVLTPILKLIRILNYFTNISEAQKFWLKEQPAMVISLMPLVNHGVKKSLEKYFTHIPFLVVCTDFDEWSPNIWIEDKNQHFICGTKKLTQQALAYGLNIKKITPTTGLIVDEKFYHPPQDSKQSARIKLELKPDLPTGIVLCGMHAGKAALKIAQQLKDVKSYQLIFMCGHNKKLEELLKRKYSNNNFAVINFTDQMPYYMHCADFFIGKPGASSVSEALVAGLPLILIANFFTMPQEKYVAQWVQEQQVGLVIKSFDALSQTIPLLLNNYADFKAHVASLNNRALYEVVDIIKAKLRA